MKSLITVILAAVALAGSGVQAQQAAWAKCGGMGWHGPTTCVLGYTCRPTDGDNWKCIPTPRAKRNKHQRQCPSHKPKVTPAPVVIYTSTPTTNAGQPDTAVPTPTPVVIYTSTPTTNAGQPDTTVPTSTHVHTPDIIPTPTVTPPTKAPPTTPTTTTSTVAAPTGTNNACPYSTKFKYFGVNQSGAEFTPGNIPGMKGKDFIWPESSSFDFFLEHGFNTFRIPFAMERMSPPATGLGGPFDSAYLDDLKTAVNYITGKGGYAVVDPHNYLRYNGAVITDATAFQSWWGKLATEFKDNSKVIFDINNEPNGITAEEAFTMMQAGVNGIRACGATTQLILVSGTSYTGAWTWISSGNSASMAGIKDPNNNWAVQMHQYLDSDGSGTSPTCVSSTVGKERMQAATEWCKSNHVKCFLGEIGAGSNQDCIDAINGALCTMQQAEGAWIGALWWAAGPWWHDYFQSIEPPNGPAIARILPEALMPFM